MLAGTETEKENERKKTKQEEGAAKDSKLEDKLHINHKKSQLHCVALRKCFGENRPSIGELWLEFLKFYSAEFYISRLVLNSMFTFSNKMKEFYYCMGTLNKFQRASTFRG